METSRVSSSSTRNTYDVTPEEEQAQASLIESRRPDPQASSAPAAPASSQDKAVQQLVTGKKDWCGSKGTEWVPDGAFGVDWSGACKAHDECYGTPGANKLLCDYALQQDMSIICAEQDGGLACQITAGIYFRGVQSSFGDDAYEAAQKAAGAK